jgi:hypothetical protein
MLRLAEPVASVLCVLRNHQARPVGDTAEDRIPRAEIDVATGLVHLDGAVWLRPDETIPPPASPAMPC